MGLLPLKLAELMLFPTGADTPGRQESGSNVDNKLIRGPRMTQGEQRSPALGGALNRPG